MGRRVEYILILAIAAVLIIPFVIKFDVKNRVKDTNSSNISSEINNFTEYEINATSLLHTLKAQSAQEIDKKWYLKKPNIKTDKINSLTSNTSLATTNKIVFSGNVVAVKTDGTIYKSNKAIYNSKTKILTTPKKFTINREVDIVSGKDLNYNSKQKLTKAKDVNATFVLKKAKK